MSDQASEFDFDTFPSFSVLSGRTPIASSMDDWEPSFQPGAPGAAYDPLRATFSDLDLAPARLGVVPAGLDDDYWAE